MLGGNAYTTEFRALDPRIGRWLSPDPITHSWQSPYVSMDNNPIALTDPMGLAAGDGVRNVPSSEHIDIPSYLDSRGTGGDNGGGNNVMMFDVSEMFTGNNTANEVKEAFSNLTQSLGNFAEENAQVPFAAPRIEAEIRINDDGGYAGVIKVTANGETVYLVTKGIFEKQKSNPGPEINQTLVYVQQALDVIGIVPVVGPFADLANACISAGTGDYTSAAISLAAIVVDGAVIAKYGKEAIEVSKPLPKVINAKTVEDIPREVLQSDKKLVIIGENMPKRVTPFAKEVIEAGGKAKTFNPKSNNPFNWMRNQQRWIHKQIKDDGVIIINIGIDPKRAVRSEYYLEELKYIDKYTK